MPAVQAQTDTGRTETEVEGESLHRSVWCGAFLPALPLLRGAQGGGGDCDWAGLMYRPAMRTYIDS